jgi:NADH-quinone oxidoreductase subunit N
MNLGSFTVAGLIYRATGSEDIRDYAGLGRRNPFLAACLAVCLISLIGLPPLAGFAAKFYVMAALAHGWWWWLVAVIGVNTVVSLYYYVRVLRQMYLVESDEPPLSVNPLGMLISGACAAMLLIMFILLSPLAGVTQSFAKMYLPAGRASTTAVTPGPVAAGEDRPGIGS